MSYAVETKKRKFHRVLESLTKSANADTATKSAATTDSSVKRPRLGIQDDGSQLASARRAILKVTRPGPRGSSAPAYSRPSFVPWDRERFLERLETFRRVDWWSPKPSAINEVKWAKRGWVCTDTARVTCVSGCGGSVVVKVPDELDELDGYDREKVQERMEVPIAGLQARYSRIIKMQDQLPAQEIIETPASFDLENTLDTLPTEQFQNAGTDIQTEAPQTAQETSSQSQPPDVLTINKAALCMALFGWDDVSDGTSGLIGCSACFRRLGLWMFRPKDNGAPPLYDTLDLAQEHLEYCPWVDGKAQSGTDKPFEKVEDLKSGWQLLVLALKVKHRRHTRLSTSTPSRAASEAPSAEDSFFDETNHETQKSNDREWWAKIRRMRQVLNVKSPKRAKPSAQ
ncbi:hypothetical protein FE257_008459 [Aspergillus nanangensis]|uniref:C3HC zinc finger domain protein n=1 Tax=Aspergillus nanangensis TaxID=2582783 RepID=A0AAD4GTJ6_ASPNN|nr:hypothetical protein FE257_008459 [Aspergillus nanangensis]